ncbi:hypothetical protein GJ688_02100 [Heliobacillus mobilis]|uniref:Uncharacterized protein n=1 Tax=Heliobacterium mobile TaxID=28064 RepID=A0A6I3SDI9_HELMO|nr:hypothetical protein [Heliobacterium mobile]MTV47775.1 hypothetical protein [Heliobacterium mobile]
MAYPTYTVRVIARAIITKTEAVEGTPDEFVLTYPEAERQRILDEVYKQRPDLKPVSTEPSETANTPPI